MIVSAVPSHFALCAFVFHYHISMPQSPDGVCVIFHLLYMFWHNHTENFELYHSKMFDYLQGRIKVVLELGLKKIIKKN